MNVKCPYCGKEFPASDEMVELAKGKVICACCRLEPKDNAELNQSYEG